jgi:hypothetical protein
MEIIINFETLSGKFARRSINDNLVSIQLVGMNQSNSVKNFVTRHKENMHIKHTLLKKIIINNMLKF